MKTFASGNPTNKSDCFVQYTPNSEPISVTTNSKLEALYGEAIQNLTRNTISSLQVNSGKVEVQDNGALDFVIMARIETAIKLALPELKQNALPPLNTHCLYNSTSDRFRRTRLYIPGDQPKLMINAGIHKPDGIILDLEDSVSPKEKLSARLIVRNALRTIDFFGAERMVRINQGELGLLDLEEVIPNNVHLILVPKIETAEQLQIVDEKIEQICQSCGRTDSVYLMPIIESALGILNALSIAQASKKNVALAIGLEDYTADIGTQRTLDGKESFFARSMIVNAARATGLQPIDTVFSDVSDMDGLIHSVEEAKSLGFDGKGCIHPRQIQPIHDAFAPTTSDIEKAKKIVLAFEDAEAKGLGVVALGSKMIDPPVVKRAVRTVQMAIAINLLPENWRDSKIILVRSAASSSSGA